MSSLLEFSCTYLILFAFEWLFQSDAPVQQIRHWWPRLIFLFSLRTLVAIFFTTALIFAFGPFTTNAVWQKLPVALSMTIALLLFTLLHYWTHRVRHDVDWFWRVFHQMHHSPKRFDLSLTFYVHPMETFLLSTFFYFFCRVFGLGLEYFAVIVFLDQILAKSQHMNVKTPHWLGYFLFRPEQHRLHHSLHNVNHGLIPLWDIVFGTFKNCRDEVGEIGFPEPAHSKFWDIFFFKKVL
jgi:sterol desaturase/sphingolipid hydroxylase (fatty acid hydroxylase superfamily)